MSAGPLVHWCVDGFSSDDYKPLTGLNRGRFCCMWAPQDHCNTSTKPSLGSTGVDSGALGHLKTNTKLLLGSTGVDSGALGHLKTTSRPLQNQSRAQLGSILMHLGTSRPPSRSNKTITGLDWGRFCCTWAPQDHPKTGTKPLPGSTGVASKVNSVTFEHLMTTSRPLQNQYWDC